jgi:hypothetical protein
MVRRGASLDPNQAWWQLLEERQDGAALQLASDHHLAGGIDAVALEYDASNAAAEPYFPKSPPIKHFLGLISGASAALPLREVGQLKKRELVPRHIFILRTSRRGYDETKAE